MMRDMHTHPHTQGTGGHSVPGRTKVLLYLARQGEKRVDYSFAFIISYAHCRTPRTFKKVASRMPGHHK